VNTQQTKDSFKESTTFPISSDTQQPPKYIEVKSGVLLESFDDCIFYSLHTPASTQPSYNTTQQAIEKLRFFTNNSLDKATERWLISFNLVQDAYKVAQKVRSFFATRPISLRRNENPDNSHLLEIWVEASDDLELEVKILNLFDNEFWIKQPEDLRKKVIVLLK
jgi:hypothetical protein